MHQSVDEHRVKKRSFAFALAYIKCFHTYSVYLSFRHGVLILYTPCHRCPLAARRSCFGIRLALADGSGLPFSLYPPLAALESQTPQREARRRFAPRFAQNSHCAKFPKEKPNIFIV